MLEIPLEANQPKTAVIKFYSIQPNQNWQIISMLHFLCPKRTSHLKAIIIGFIKTSQGLIEGLIKNHLIKSIKTTIGHLHMRIQVLKSTINKPPDTDLEAKCKTYVVFYTTLDPSTKKKGKFTLNYANGSQSNPANEINTST